MSMCEPTAEEQNARGFTLVEMLVVVAIFSIAALVVTNIFLLTSRSSQRAASSQKIQSDVRFALEAMARDVRFGTIDYDCYNTVPSCDPDNLNASIDLTTTNGLTSLLAIRDADGNRTRYKVRTVSGVSKLEVCAIQVRNELLTKCDVPGPWQVVTPEDVKIVKGEFYLFPYLNPFKLQPEGSNPYPYAANAQPRATIILKTQQTTNVASPEKISLQTTVISRLYAR